MSGHALCRSRGHAAAIAISIALGATPALAMPDRATPAGMPAVPLVRVQAVAAISPDHEPAPNLFEQTGAATWDGKRTLQGIWVAHPLAPSARRVRIFNTETGVAVDGALFKRDPSLVGPSVLVSSEAAQFLGMKPGEEVDLRIVALTPVQAPRVASKASGTAGPDVEPATAAGSVEGAEEEAAPPADRAAAAKPPASDPDLPARPGAGPGATMTASQVPSAPAAAVDGGVRRLGSTSAVFRSAPPAVAPDAPTSDSDVLATEGEVTESVAPAPGVAAMSAVIGDAPAEPSPVLSAADPSARVVELPLPHESVVAKAAAEPLRAPASVADLPVPVIAPVEPAPAGTEEPAFDGTSNQPAVGAGRDERDPAAAPDEPAVASGRDEPADTDGWGEPAVASGWNEFAAALGLQLQPRDAVVGSGEPPSAASVEPAAVAEAGEAAVAAEPIEVAAFTGDAPITQAATGSASPAEPTASAPVSLSPERVSAPAPAESAAEALSPEPAADADAAGDEPEWEGALRAAWAELNAPEPAALAAADSAALAAADSAELAAAAPVEPAAADSAEPNAGDPAKLAATDPVEPAPGAAALSMPYVQAGIFTAGGNATRLIEQIEAAGLPALGKQRTLNGRPATRVLAGPFADAAERDAALRAIRDMGLRDAFPSAQ